MSLYCFNVLSRAATAMRPNTDTSRSFYDHVNDIATLSQSYNLEWFPSLPLWLFLVSRPPFSSLVPRYAGFLTTSWFPSTYKREKEKWEDKMLFLQWHFLHWIFLSRVKDARRMLGGHTRNIFNNVTNLYIWYVRYVHSSDCKSLVL